jgi:hypothetical protein
MSIAKNKTGKAGKAPPGVYRDDPDRDDAPDFHFADSHDAPPSYSDGSAALTANNVNKEVPVYASNQLTPPIIFTSAKPTVTLAAELSTAP